MKGKINFMKKIPQEYILNITFAKALNREELLVKKLNDYYKQCGNREMKKMLRIFNKTSNEHSKLLRQLMMNLNIKGSGGVLR